MGQLGILPLRRHGETRGSDRMVGQRIGANILRSWRSDCFCIIIDHIVYFISKGPTILVSCHGVLALYAQFDHNLLVEGPLWILAELE